MVTPKVDLLGPGRVNAASADNNMASEKPEPAGRHSNRLVRIIQVHRLHSQRTPASRIARALGVSRRTIFRDLKTLREVYEQLGTQRLDGEE